MIIAAGCYRIFESSITNYHLHDDVEAPCVNPYQAGSLQHMLYEKNWIDTIQWHLEDAIRCPDIACSSALMIKRRIDKLNQERTDLVEAIDDIFFQRYGGVTLREDATLNTESVGWALDRLSILALKIYHMQAELQRQEVMATHLERCQKRMVILFGQKADLLMAIDQLLYDIKSGKKIMRVYRQLKMYNDPSLNPVLYQRQTKG